MVFGYFSSPVVQWKQPLKADCEKRTKELQEEQQNALLELNNLRKKQAGLEESLTNVNATKNPKKYGKAIENADKVESDIHDYKAKLRSIQTKQIQELLTVEQQRSEIDHQLKLMYGPKLSQACEAIKIIAEFFETPKYTFDVSAVLNPQLAHGIPLSNNGMAVLQKSSGIDSIHNYSQGGSVHADCTTYCENKFACTSPKRPELKIDDKSSKQFSRDVASVLDGVMPRSVAQRPTPAPDYEEIRSTQQRLAEQERLRKQEEEQRREAADKTEKARQRELAQERIKRQREEDFKRSADNIQRQKMENQSRSAKCDEDNEEKLQEARERREEYKRETDRLQKERLENYRQCLAIILNCVKMKYRFAESEKAWSDWLALLQRSIAAAKEQFRHFEKFCRVGNVYHRDANEIEDLHSSTVSAYALIYDAFYDVKEFSETYQDRVFLLILLKEFQMISDKLFRILNAIDEFKSHKGTATAIRDRFGELNAFEIPTTGKLRIMSTGMTPTGYQNYQAPQCYSRDDQGTSL